MTDTPSLASPYHGEQPGAVILYSYWRSSCSWRVRIALHFKEIPFEYRAVNLLKSEQQSEEYSRNINPAQLVPTLIIDNHVLNQSVAILEYLEERRPETWRLMPQEPSQRAQVRALVQLIASDTQPIQNLRVLNYLTSSASTTAQEKADKKAEWARHWIGVGLEAFERTLGKTAGLYCVGDSVTLADICLVPQLYNAVRFQVPDLERRFPLIWKINQRLEKLEPFQLAHPDQQPDAVK